MQKRLTQPKSEWADHVGWNELESHFFLIGMDYIEKVYELTQELEANNNNN